MSSSTSIHLKPYNVSCIMSFKIFVIPLPLEILLMHGRRKGGNMVLCIGPQNVDQISVQCCMDP